MTGFFGKLKNDKTLIVRENGNVIFKKKIHKKDIIDVDLECSKN